MKIFRLAAPALCSLLLAMNSHATGVYEFDWLGGKPGFSGKLFLDGPTSASSPHGGTPADVLAGSFLTTPLGTYSIFDTSFTLATTPWSPDVIWDQNHVIDMVLFFQPISPIIDPIYGQPTEAVAQTGYFAVNNGLETTIIQGGGGWFVPANETDYTGQWLAAVPEPGTFTLLSLVALGFLVLRPRVKAARASVTV